jgi:hypothetical protein
VSISAVANLASQTGETIQIRFDAETTGSSGGGSYARSVIAQNIRIVLTVPGNRPLSGWFMAQLFSRLPGGAFDAQAVILQNPGGRVYSGKASGSVLIATGGTGPAQTYEQMHEFTPQGGGSTGSLIDPWNRTPRFRTTLFDAVP